MPPMENLIMAPPRMSRYIQKSAEVIGVFLEFVDEKDIHVYSIDESFLDVTDYLGPAKISAVDYARRIMETVKSKTGLTVTCGIGENIFMAKAAMDIEAKKRPDFLAAWSKRDIPIKLWPLTPLSQMWGIGERLEKRLNDLGFYTVGEIANSNVEYLKSKLGIIGEEIHNHANGIDEARIGEVYVPESKSLSAGQVLFEDYSKEQGMTVLKDMADEVLFRLRQEQLLARGVHLYVGYSGSSGSMKKSMRFQEATSDSLLIKKAFIELYRSVRDDAMIRRFDLTLTGLTNSNYIQLDLFTDWEDFEKRRRLSTVIDEIKNHYGIDAIKSATGAKKESTSTKRSKEIGGHRK